MQVSTNFVLRHDCTDAGAMQVSMYLQEVRRRGRQHMMRP